MAENSNVEAQSVASKLLSRWIRLSLVAGGTVFLIWAWRHAHWTPLRFVGACLMSAGLVLWIVAQFQLGDSFSITPQARALVTHGIYSRIRNPIYVSSAVFVLGLALFIHRLELLAILAAMILIQVMRARKEARVLEEKFGDAYREYRRKTWF